MRRSSTKPQRQQQKPARPAKQTKGDLSAPALEAQAFLKQNGLSNTHALQLARGLENLGLLW